MREKMVCEAGFFSGVQGISPVYSFSGISFFSKARKVGGKNLKPSTTFSYVSTNSTSCMDSSHQVQQRVPEKTLRAFQALVKGLVETVIPTATHGQRPSINLEFKLKSDSLKRIGILMTLAFN
jgi:hypothetical protein